MFRGERCVILHLCHLANGLYGRSGCCSLGWRPTLPDGEDTSWAPDWGYKSLRNLKSRQTVLYYHNGPCDNTIACPILYSRSSILFNSVNVSYMLLFLFLTPVWPLHILQPLQAESSQLFFGPWLQETFCVFHQSGTGREQACTEPHQLPPTVYTQTESEGTQEKGGLHGLFSFSVNALQVNTKGFTRLCCQSTVS